MVLLAFLGPEVPALQIPCGPDKLPQSQSSLGDGGRDREAALPSLCHRELLSLCTN